MKFRELFGMWNRPSLVFEEGPNASDPNNPNASGGERREKVGHTG
jgi:hypothetical protein